MKTLILSTILGTSLSACVVGHPSTDKNHSHVDTSSTRYDKYDENYDYHDKTKHLNKKRLYKTHDAEDHTVVRPDRQYYSDNGKRYYLKDGTRYYLDDDIRYYYDSEGDAYYHDARGHRVYKKFN